MASMQSKMRSSASLSRGVIDHHPIAADLLRQRGTPHRSGQHVDISAKEPLRVRHEADALTEPRAVSGQWLVEQVDVRIWPEVRPRRGPEHEDPAQAGLPGQRTEAPNAGGHKPLVQAPERARSDVPVPGSVREGPVNRACQNVHALRPQTWREVPEELLPQVLLARELDLGRYRGWA